MNVSVKVSIAASEPEKPWYLVKISISNRFKRLRLDYC